MKNYLLIGILCLASLSLFASDKNSVWSAMKRDSHSSRYSKDKSFFVRIVGDRLELYASKNPSKVIFHTLVSEEDKIDFTRIVEKAFKG